MPENGKIASELLPIRGVRLYACDANIRYSKRNDLSLIELSEGSSLAAVFTTNAFCAAPVQIAREHLLKRRADEKSFLIINAGNANAGTGKPGYQNALSTCEMISQKFSVSMEQVLPFSTGVIGEQLELEKFEKAIDAIQPDALQENRWYEVSEAILTTDTCAKGKSITLEVDGEKISLTGIAKGSGMIKPDMATMLAYIATDARIEDKLLSALLKKAADNSFNCISVDGDTSTNDALVLMASGKSPVRIEEGSETLEAFSTALEEICLHLAQAIVRDGEGATKFIEISVAGGRDEQECKEVAYTIAHSPLVKTAFFASDPNWGRILAALGRSRIQELDLSKVNISLGSTPLITLGEVATGYSEEKGQQEMNQSDIRIDIELGRGESSAKVWTCDLSYDYVKINAEYRS